MNNKAKMIFFFWRIPLYFLAASILFFIISASSEKLGGPAGALLLFITFPGFVISFVRALFLTVKKTIEFSRTGWPEDVIFPEVEACKSLSDYLSNEIDSVRELSPRMKLRYFLFRIAGILCIAGGIVLAFIGIYIIGTLVIIAGATLCITANPRTYNSQVEGVRMIPCREGDDIGKIYRFCKDNCTPLGTPYLADVRGFNTEVMVYGPDSDDNTIIVYHAPKADYFYVSSAFMPGRIERVLSEPGILPEKSSETDEPFNEDYALEFIVTCVETALEQK